MDMSLQDEYIDAAAKKLVEDIDKELLWTMIKDAHSSWFLVQVPWRNEPEGNTWTDACAWALETFGLPGDLYKTNPGRNSMEFLFKNEKDAILMSLKWL
jgi:hypothetical protein